MLYMPGWLSPRWNRKARPWCSTKAEGELSHLDAAVITEIVDRVKAWYDALPKQLLPT